MCLAATAVGTEGKVGSLLVRSGDDIVSFTKSGTKGASTKLSLGNGDNRTNVAGTVAGDLRQHVGEGNHKVTLQETATIAEDFFASQTSNPHSRPQLNNR